jgi:hypothetical protein
VEQVMRVYNLKRIIASLLPFFQNLFEEMDKNLNNTVCLLLSSASERIKQLDT